MINTDLENASKIMIGSLEAEAMYIGSTLIWQLNQLPYDTEIEYLESNGRQYIDTCIHINSLYNFELELSNTRAESGFAIGGRLGINNSDHHIGFPSGGGIRFRNHKAAKVYNFDSNIFYTVKSENDNLLFNGNIQTPKSVDNLNKNSFLLDNITYYLFGINNGGTITYANGIKIKSVKIFNELNNIIFDAYAVKKDGIGYMYDKVSKQLFENLGTADFILGPDKI